MTSHCEAPEGDASSGAGFELDAAPLLSRATVDRREALRDDPTEIAALWQNGYLLPVDRRGRAPMRTVQGIPQLAHQPATEHSADPASGAVFLGALDGRGYWARRASAGEVEAEGDADWRDLRASGGLLADTDAGLLTTAVGLLAWHERARYCGVCGATLSPARGGWMRTCSGCAREEYPRTDPAVICLVHDGGDQVLLARQPAWPSDRYSVLAGFVEVGESLEACVQREISEEVGITVQSVRYLASQPWPFPRSLMLGFAAIGDPDQPLRPADSEIAEARWVSRTQVRAALDAGTAVDGIGLPPSVSIAHRMIAGWAKNAGD